MEKIEKFSCNIWITILGELSQHKAGNTLFNLSGFMFNPIGLRDRNRHWGDGINLCKK